MTAILHTRRAGDGKTDIALRYIQDALELDPFRRVWVLLPTELQIASFRARLSEKMERVCFGVETFDFYGLYERLLKGLGDPQSRIRDTARFRILRHVLGLVTLNYFSAIAKMPGFVRVIAELIQELKQARVTPEAFAAIARTPKDRELAMIYGRYQDFLRERRLVDAEGEGWLALEDLRRRTDRLDAHLMIVDGFDQFNIVQAEMLGALAAKIDQVVVTLTYEETRKDTAHRRFAQTRERLLRYVEIEVGGFDPPKRETRPAALTHLTETIFEAVTAKATADPSLSLIEAPDPRREVETVLRRVKRAILDGTPPEQIAVVARDLTEYAPYLLEYSAAYGLPVHLRSGAPLGENPVIAALLALTDLHTGNFGRRALIDTLQNPYLANPFFDPEQIGQLDQISREFIVTQGRERWLSAIQASTVQQVDEDGVPTVEGMTQAAIDALNDGLTGFCDRVTPPEQATVREYVVWLEGLLGAENPELTPPPSPLPRIQGGGVSGIEESPHPPTPSPPAERGSQETDFGIIGQIRHNPTYAARDLAALKCLRRVFRDLIAGDELIALPAPPLAWTEFRRDLGIAIDNARLQLHQDGGRDPARFGRVLISSVYDVRGLGHRSLYVLGLSEGQFPRPAREDELYLDHERSALNGALNALLGGDAVEYLITRAGETDERSLFYEMSALPLESLTLSRPYNDGNAPWPASPYWKAVERTLAVTVIRLPMSGAVRLDQASRFSEVATALAGSLNRPMVDAASQGVLRWLEGHPIYAGRWRNAELGRAVEMIRRDRTQISAFSGYLQHPAMRAMVREKLGPERLWSASQFNEYGQCPFRFFAKRLLKLEELTEPEAGMTVLQRGNVLHAALEGLYGRYELDGLTITPDNREQALALIDAVVTPIFAEAPAKFGFLPGALWEREQHELAAQLRGFVGRDFSADSPLSKLLPGARRSIRQEMGFDGGGALLLDGEAGAIRVRGKIDRVDVVGDQAVVIDYKSGSSDHKLTEMVNGRDVQMLLYVQGAGRALPGVTVSDAVFMHVKKAVILRDPVDTEKNAETLDQARKNLTERIIRARNADFSESPTKIEEGKCTKYCEFSGLCRIGVVRA